MVANEPPPFLGRFVDFGVDDGVEVGSTCVDVEAVVCWWEEGGGVGVVSEFGGRSSDEDVKGDFEGFVGRRSEGEVERFECWRVGVGEKRSEVRHERLEGGCRLNDPDEIDGTSSHEAEESFGLEGESLS